MYLTNNFPGLCVLTLCIMFSLFLASLPGISTNSDEYYRHYNFQNLANISGKFPEILNFRKFHNTIADYTWWHKDHFVTDVHDLEWPLKHIVFIVMFLGLFINLWHMCQSTSVYIYSTNLSKYWCFLCVTSLTDVWSVTWFLCRVHSLLCFFPMFALCCCVACIFSL